MSPKHGDTNSKASAVRDNNVLPSKEQNIFKAVVRLYETKQLKKALKSADSILKKFPDHGETLAMKGLTLNALDKKSEATELVRRGLRMDMRSHVCWHVYGLLYRSKRDYREAAKAYLNALRIDKDNQQILRDLALLQVQIRDYDGLEDTRRRLLTVRPNQQNNWIGFALSYHLLGNYSTAISVLDAYHDTLAQSEEEQDRYELSELLLYKNMLLEEGGRFSDALAHLDEVSSRIVDRLSVLEARARLYAAQGSFKTAQTHFERLINLNPDNYSYQYALHLCSLQEDIPLASNSECTTSSKIPKMTFKTSSDWCTSSLRKIRAFDDEKDISRVLKKCDYIASSHPYSLAAQRIALDIVPSAKHQQFLPRTDAYVRRFLRKGIPSLFSDLKSVYDDYDKAQALGTLFENFLESLDGSGGKHLPTLTQSSNPIDDDAEKTVDEDHTLEKQVSEPVEPPCSLLWVLHFLAQHYDRLGLYRKALDTIERALKHTPTAIECYMVKAKILKHLGDFTGAVEAAGEARTLDLADRYLNSKCCKHALRADRVVDAESWVSLFTRDGDSGGAQALYDMQCIWFEVGAGESYMRTGQLALALKKLSSIERIFADMVEDQFDFHSYCLRKVTLRAYVTLLRFEDRIRRHPYFARSTRGLIQCLLRIFNLTDDERRVLTGDHGDIKGYAQMTDSQRKKALSKRKKQLMRQRQGHSSGGHGRGSLKTNGTDGNAQDASGGGNNPSGGGGSGSGKGNANSTDKAKGAGSVESDPNGVEQLKELLKDGLGANGSILKEAGRLTRELQIHLPDDLATQLLCFEVASRRKQYLIALRAVRQAQRLNRDDGRCLRIAVQLAHEVSQLVGSNDSTTEQKVGSTVGLKSWTPVVEKVFQQKGDVLGGLTIPKFVNAFVDRNSTNSTHLLLAFRVRLWMVRVGIVSEERQGKTSSLEEKLCDEMCEIINRSKFEGGADDSLSAPFCRDFILDLKADRVAGNVIKRLGECLKAKFSLASCF